MKNLLQLNSNSLSPMGRAGVGLLFFLFSSCTELQPVTMGGVENPHVNSLSQQGVDAEFGVKVKNPNNFRVTVFPSSFDATVNGVDVGKIKLDKRVRIKANSDESPVFHLKSNFSKLGFGDMANVLPMLSSKRADVTLKGYVRVGKWYYKKKFPVDLKKSIPLSK